MNRTGYSAVTAAMVVASPAFGQVWGLESPVSTATAPRSASSTLGNLLNSPMTGSFNVIGGSAETGALNSSLDGALNGSLRRERKGNNSAAGGKIGVDGRISADRAGNSGPATRIRGFKIGDAIYVDPDKIYAQSQVRASAGASADGQAPGAINEQTPLHQSTRAESRQASAAEKAENKGRQLDEEAKSALRGEPSVTHTAWHADGRAHDTSTPIEQNSMRISDQRGKRATEWIRAIMSESKRVLTHTGERIRVEIPPARRAGGQAAEGFNHRARNQARNTRRPVTRARNAAETFDAIDEFPATANDKSVQALER